MMCIFTHTIRVLPVFLIAGTQLGHGITDNGMTQEPSVILSPSEFRCVRETDFEGRDLFELAIHAGLYERTGSEYLPGAERGAVSLNGRTWHGSNGVGLVAYDPHMKRYSIYYLREHAVLGHHLDILYADDDLILFSYGNHPDLPDVRPALEVYSDSRKCFARIESVSTQDGSFGYVSMEALVDMGPDTVWPSIGWDDRPYENTAFVPLCMTPFSRPDPVECRDGEFILSYHSSWNIDSFTTTLRFKRADLLDELDRIEYDMKKEEPEPE